MLFNTWNLVYYTFLTGFDDEPRIIGVRPFVAAALFGHAYAARRMFRIMLAMILRRVSAPKTQSHWL